MITKSFILYEVSLSSFILYEGSLFLNKEILNMMHVKMQMHWLNTEHVVCVWGGGGRFTLTPNH